MRIKSACLTLLLGGFFTASTPIQTTQAHQQLTPASQVTPGNAPGADDAFQKAVKAYEMADFQGAIEKFSQVAMYEHVDREMRRDALHYLGRSYLAMRNQDDARDALERLAEYEPPRIKLDPDVEPPQFLRMYYDVHKDRDGGYAMPEENVKYTLAIVDFTNQSVDDFQRLAPLSTGLASLMINQLNGATDLKVVERERIQWLLDELDLQQDEKRVDQQTAVKAGKLLGVHMVLMGSYMKFGKTMMLTARLVNVETGEIMMTDQVQGKADDVLELAESLSIGVARNINVQIENRELGSRFQETRSLDALLSYSEGLDLLESNDYRAAYEKFLEAYEYDRTYQRAYVKAKSLEPLIAAG